MGTTRIVREQKRSTWEAPPLTADYSDARCRSMFLRAMAFADDIGLDDDKRHALAQMIPGVDKDGDGSWKNLNGKQLHDLNCMLDGFIWITYLLDSDLDNDPTTK